MSKAMFLDNTVLSNLALGGDTRSAKTHGFIALETRGGRVHLEASADKNCLTLSGVKRGLCLKVFAISCQAPAGFGKPLGARCDAWRILCDSNQEG